MNTARYLANNDAPDLILLDAMMPGMSGYEVARKLREDFPPQLPIIMISAKSTTEDVVRGLGFTCNDYLTKPFVKEEVLARIETQVNVHGVSGWAEAWTVKLKTERAQKTAHNAAVFKFLLGSGLAEKYLGCIDEAGVLSPHRVGLETAVDLYGIATATMGEWIQFEKMLLPSDERSRGRPQLVHANQHMCALFSGWPQHAVDALRFADAYLDALKADSTFARVEVKIVLHSVSESDEPLIAGVVGPVLIGNAVRLCKYILDEVPPVACGAHGCVLVTAACLEAHGEEQPPRSHLIDYGEVIRVNSNGDKPPERVEEYNATTGGHRLASPIGLEAAPSPEDGAIEAEIAESGRLSDEHELRDRGPTVPKSSLHKV
ncbi:sensory transduction histidine kinase, putative [Perkinsus marinus ATCC 50983]|uniref:Sensory transduction histidine kinase, putative n=1 Tax=Perkinsus marinus (strain ATCC 50983 / TXsc) TaxID=423536 RepID=C5KAA7_PERM5|nr:sensory transduction histidine kinase, putative [Perkinsus marinus ATCC 50983]EER18568.1 sensory transduction histidine kinase, putative [Perkinsus marinus ATCC 50983]|eukprot:XP_002786772.1 sensory transduction histidine kinase, putative [Perkinsus marinus ATCC 50983]